MSDPVEELIRQAQGRVGSTLKGKYRLERLLGLGGMAAVYEGVHRNSNRVAIKIVHRQLSVDAEVRSRFLQEGYAANNVEHPGVVKTLDDDLTEDGSVFLVMELLQGEALDDDWEIQKPRPPEEVLALGFQLLDVLAAAGAKGIVHRDLKPQNIFVTNEGVLKVLDFGLARMEEASAAHATMSGQVFGTPAFMPPEQALGRVSQIDHLSDQWAAGATLFSLLSGKFVHDAQTSAEHLIMTATRPARSLATVAPSLPKPIVDVIDRSLAYEKANRFPSARAMQDALEAAFQAAYGRPIPAQRVAPTAPGAPPSVVQGLPPVSTTVRENNAATLKKGPASASGGRGLMWIAAAAMSGVIIAVAAFLLQADAVTAESASDGSATPASTEGATEAVGPEVTPEGTDPATPDGDATATTTASASASAPATAAPSTADASASSEAPPPPVLKKRPPPPPTKKAVKPPDKKKKKGSSAWDTQ